MALTNNRFITDWVAEMAALTKPDRILWLDGSQEQLEELRRESMSTGEMIRLNEETLPGCYLHRSALNDVARVEDRTYICSKRQEDAGPTNNWMDPDKMKAMLLPLFDGAMRGRTMYVIPYSMGVVGSPFAKYGIELSDSIYVATAMASMTRRGKEVYEALARARLHRGLHAKAELDRKSVISCISRKKIHYVRQLRYGGNVHGAECFALLIASALAVGKLEWPSICSFWALRIPRARFATWPPPSLPPAERRIWPC